MKFFCEQQNIDRAPAVETCIQWELKLGLYKLTRIKEAADDWIWIMDHVVSKGAHKCLVILGVRMSHLSKKNDLTISYEDVEPLAVVPMKISNGTLMEFELEEVLKANHGKPPLAILKDHGSDLHCGGRLFCEEHPEVINLYDVTHKIARMYEHELVENESWNRFTKKCADFKKQVQLTEYSAVASPNQRSKARYHNIDVLVDWGQKQLLEYDSQKPEIQKKIEWLKSYTKELECWGQLVEVGRFTRDFVRQKGLSVNCHLELRDKLVDIKLCQSAENFVCDLLDFIETEGSKVPQGKCVIGSSEIVESLFGTHKNISEKGPKPMGRLILTLASRVGEAPSEALVQAAFEEIKEKDVDMWVKNAFA